jgi:hypothetical protein
MEYLSKILRLLRTVRFLKISQIFYQIYYRFKSKPKFKLLGGDDIIANSNDIKVVFLKKPYKKISFKNSNVKFEFLNQEVEFFDSQINWNYSVNGKLWTYHLNYFDFLFSASPNSGLQLIQQFISCSEDLVDGLEPYPTSLRIINWIKFDLSNRCFSKDIRSVLRSDLERLNSYLEFHIQANHLLENALALYAGSIYFKSSPFKNKVKKLLIFQIKEQFGKTGFHYEGTFMYHLSLMERLLDVFQISKSLNVGDSEIEDLIEATIKKGMRIANSYQTNGLFPNFNDSNSEETPDFFELCIYAKNQGFIFEDYCPISDIFLNRSKSLSIIADFSNIRPIYQPGHSHADTFNFVLFDSANPIIVDPGISTYEKNAIRELERSTIMHNTIIINNEDSSEVWSGFRVGRRAEVSIVKQDSESICAFHNGYAHIGVIHERTIKLVDDLLEIRDKLINQNSHIAVSSIYFHPDVKINITDSRLILNDSILFEWAGVKKWQCLEYEYAEGYNNRKKGIVWRAEVNYLSTLKIMKNSL